MPAFYHFNTKRPEENLVLSENHKLPGYVAKYLTDFQLEGIRFLFKHFKNNYSCILNDESGLGKTVMVCAFLDAVLPHDSSRNCLIIVKNDERIKNWKFHLDVLTKLPTKIVYKEEDVGKGILYLTKWDSLQKSGSLARCNFDCIIIDNKDDLMANKICSGYLLRNYENKISLIISSVDVAVDLRQFHTMLRLCGRLDKRYENFNAFENKFALPEDVNMLESYFLRREKIINFCRDFRLRRYRHQFENELPLAQPDDYLNSLKMWAQNPASNSMSSSSSVKILTSSSEKDAEQLLRLYFDPNEENELNVEVSKITSETNSKPNYIGDMDEMSPLLFESDTEDKGLERLEYARSSPLLRKSEREFIVPIVKVGDKDKIVPIVKAGEKDKIEKIVPIVKVSGKDKIEKSKVKSVGKVIPQRNTRSTRNTTKVAENKLNSNKSDTLTQLRGTKIKKTKKAKKFAPMRSMRSHLATRSKALKSKYLIIDLTDENTAQIYSKKSKKRVRNMRKRIKREKDENKVKVIGKESGSQSVASRPTRSNAKRAKIPVVDKPGRIKKIKGAVKHLIKDSKLKSQTNSLSKDTITSTKTREKSKNDKAIINKEKNAEDIPKRQSSSEKNSSKNKAQSDSELKNSGDVRIVSPQDQIIVLSSSTECEDCTPLLSGSLNKTKKSSKIMPSPDIFSNVAEEYDISCSQKSRLSNRFKALDIPLKGGAFKKRHSSCLDLLETEFQKEKRNTIQETEEIFEISTSETFRNVLRGNEDQSEITPIKSRTVTFQKNKITKYLIGNDALSQSLELCQPIEVSEYRRNGDNYPKTPMRQKVTQKSTNTSKKSPKAAASRDVTPNNLTKWLIKSDSANSSISKPSKRRRLDLWFND